MRSVDAVVHEWLEPHRLPVGGKASWCGGRLRLTLESIELVRYPRGWLASLIPGLGEPRFRRIAFAFEIPCGWRSEWEASIEHAEPLPQRLGAFHDDLASYPLLARRPASVFEALEIGPRDKYVVVRAGRGEAPPETQIEGDLSALDPEAQRFVHAWLELPLNLGLAGKRAHAVAAAPLEGYRLRLSPHSTGYLVLTFHRAGERYYVRTYGGCARPIETWYGPYVPRGGTYKLEGAF